MRYTGGLPDTLFQDLAPGSHCARIVVMWLMLDSSGAGLFLDLEVDN